MPRDSGRGTVGRVGCTFFRRLSSFGSGSFSSILGLRRKCSGTFISIRKLLAYRSLTNQGAPVHCSLQQLFLINALISALLNCTLSLCNCSVPTFCSGTKS